MKRQEFITSENMTLTLRRLLDDPVMQNALEIVRQEGVPREPLHGAGDLIHQAALNGARACGWSAALQNLELLTRFQKPASKDEAREYDDAAIQRLVALGYTEAQAKQAMTEYHLLNQPNE